MTQQSPRRRCVEALLALHQQAPETYARAEDVDEQGDDHASDAATRTPSIIPGISDGTITLPHRWGRESPIVRDISSRTGGIDRTAVAVFSRIGHDTINATATTPLS